MRSDEQGEGGLGPRGRSTCQRRAVLGKIKWLITLALALGLQLVLLHLQYASSHFNHSLLLPSPKKYWWRCELSSSPMTIRSPGLRPTNPRTDIAGPCLFSIVVGNERPTTVSTLDQLY